MELQEIFHLQHKNANVFQQSQDHIKRMKNEIKLIRRDKCPAAEHEKTYNAPVAGEIAIIMLNEQSDIILQQRSGHLYCLSKNRRTYASLQYSLIFWNGYDGKLVNLWKRTL